MHLAATQCKDILRELQRSYIFKHFLVSKILTTMFDIDFRWFDTFLRFEIVNILSKSNISTSKFKNSKNAIVELKPQARAAARAKRKRLRDTREEAADLQANLRYVVNFLCHLRHNRCHFHFVGAILIVKIKMYSAARRTLAAKELVAAGRLPPPSKPFR